jgi:hypothetical protein
MSLTCTLHQEAQDITPYECFGEPGCFDYGVRLPFCQTNNTTEHHIYGRREEGRGDQNVGVLDDERHETIVAWFLSCGRHTCRIANKFHYNPQLSAPPI